MDIPGRQLKTMHLFAGAGGGILADLLLGHRPVCAVEIDSYCRRVLLERQKDGILPRFPIWDDVKTFDGREWRGGVDIVAGGFPCQDISCAGKNEGITGARSGLWSEMARIIGEVRPRYAFVENSPLLVGRGLTTVLGDLAEMGYDARWCYLSAENCGAPHRRNRIWIVANSYGERQLQSGRPITDEWGRPSDGRQEVADALRSGPSRHEFDGSGRSGESGATGSIGREDQKVADPDEQGLERQRGKYELRDSENEKKIGRGGWWRTEPDVGRVADGVVARVDRLKALGNGQVPAVAALAWRILSEKTELL